MSKLQSLAHSRLDRRPQPSKTLCLPLRLLLLPVILALALFILVLVVWTELRRTQGEFDLFEFDREPDLSPETSQESRSAAAAAADHSSSEADSPPRFTCTFYRQGPNGPPSAGLSSSPRSSTSSGSADSVAAPESADTSPLADSEAHDSVPEQAAPAKNTTTMQSTGAAAASPNGPLQPTASASPQTRAASGAELPALTHEQRNDASDRNDKEDSETTRMIKRRTVRMREEGVRLTVSYSQLTNPVPTRMGAAGVAVAVAADSSPSSPGPLTPPTPSSGSGSGSPTSAALLLVPGAALPAPALSVATPRSPSPQKQQVRGASSVLPTSGADAGAALVRIEEKLLAVPADAVSRRLLIDGRAILKRKIRTPRSASSLNGNGGWSSQGLTSAEGGKPSSGYPSELME